MLCLFSLSVVVEGGGGGVLFWGGGEGILSIGQGVTHISNAKWGKICFVNLNSNKQIKRYYSEPNVGI